MTLDDEQRKQEEDPMPARSVMPSMSAIAPLPSSTSSSSAWTPALRTSQRVPTISVS